MSAKAVRKEGHSGVKLLYSVDTTDPGLTERGHRPLPHAPTALPTLVSSFGSSRGDPSSSTSSLFNPNQNQYQDQDSGSVSSTWGPRNTAVSDRPQVPPFGVGGGGGGGAVEEKKGKEVEDG